MQCVLLDIEGTTSSVRFVYDVMFPYARQHVGDYLQNHWDKPATQHAVSQMAHDAGYADSANWFTACSESPQKIVLDQFNHLMDQDVKATGLKMLQGLIWETAFHNGQIKAHVYDDVPHAMKHWHEQGVTIHIYSSGSIPTQKLFFGHTVAGNLLPMITGHYDTTVGPKRHVDSYRAILSEISMPADNVLFISDIVAELDAAKLAGMQTALSMRPENAPVDEPHEHRVVRGFDEV